MPIALDAMGGDRAPEAIIAGAVLAVQQGHGPITLVGDADRIQNALTHHRKSGVAFEVVHAPEVIGMAEHPARAARSKRNSSLHRGYQLVRDNQACAFVSAGNSGAMMAVGILVLRRVPRCDRPAIASAIPSLRHPIVLLDMGANVECRASHLVQFALMGAVFAEAALDRPRPSIGLLSNGVEPTKGTETLREAHRLLTMTDVRYLGYIEGRSVPMGEVDVVVTDGLVGNVVLKVSEGVVQALMEKLRVTLKGDWMGSMGALFMKRALQKLKAEVDWTQVGGAPLLGLNGLAVVAHGESTPEAIAHAVARTRAYAALDLPAKIRTALDADCAPTEQTNTAELPLTRS